MEQFPNLNVGGKIPLFFEKIQNAAVPDRFTYKFLIDTLDFKGTNDRPLISLLKCLDFLDGNGNPTEAYRSYKNTQTSRITLGKQIKKCYSMLYERNESIHDQDNTTITICLCNFKNTRYMFFTDALLCSFPDISSNNF